MTPLLVLLGGAVGASLRYLTDRAVRARHAGVFPWGTFVVNVVGSLLLGGLTAAADALPPATATLLGTGFCGALSTYSTFGYETVRLMETGAYRYAVRNVAASVLVGLGAAALGHLIGTALT